jgi:hypothetical protein
MGHKKTYALTLGQQELAALAKVRKLSGHMSQEKAIMWAIYRAAGYEVLPGPKGHPGPAVDRQTGGEGGGSRPTPSPVQPGPGSAASV